MTQRQRDAAFAAALVALVFVLYRKADRLWWTYDDAYNLHLVIGHRLRAFFVDGALWPQKLFTPIEPVSFRVQLSAFGLAPARWFVAQLALFAASALAVYAAARAWLADLEAFAGTAMYVASVPVVSLVTQLSATHYFIAIGLGAVAMRLYARGWDVASAALYLVAMLAKEIAIPLVLLLLVLTPRDRVRRLAPHAIALIVCLAWRRAVIGTIAGGYGWAVGPGEWPSLIASLPKKLFLAMTGSGVIAGSIVIALMVAGIALAFRNRHAMVVFAVALILAVGPIVPVSKELQKRYALMPWMVLSFAFVTSGRRALLIAAPILAIVANRQEWSGEYARILRMSDEGRAFWEMPPNGLLRKPIMPPAAMGELNWLRCDYEKHACGAAWFFDDLYLCTIDVAGKRVWEYAPQSRAVVEITPHMPSIKSNFCSTVRDGAPLSAEFHYRHNALFWTFGPYADGQYRVLFGNGVQAFDVPRSDGFRLPGVPGLSIRIGYQSPAGWVTYSPEIALDFRRRPDERWMRR